MKKLYLLFLSAALMACNSATNNTSSNAESVNADSTQVVTDTTTAVTAEEEKPVSRITTELPVSKEEVQRAWNLFRDYNDIRYPDSYLCYDIDGDGTPEVFLANRSKKVAFNARAFYTLENGKLKLHAHTCYPVAGGPIYNFYIGENYCLFHFDSRGLEDTSYIIKNSKVDRVAYKSMLIVGFDEKTEEAIYEFEEGGEPMMGKDMDHLEPSKDAAKFLDIEAKGLVEINDIEGWQKL